MHLGKFNLNRLSMMNNKNKNMDDVGSNGYDQISKSIQETNSIELKGFP